ncbi:MAG: DUF4158 domain-containing protein [Gammaproteobacteria bacterium]|nr:DUF4158 domain-containing protein [Gammaproteobacteria bacterium]
MKHIWDGKELADHWSLTFEELELLTSKPARHYLPFCVQLKHYQSSGAFPLTFSDIPEVSLQYFWGNWRSFKLKIMSRK